MDTLQKATEKKAREITPGFVEKSAFDSSTYILNKFGYQTLYF